MKKQLVCILMVLSLLFCGCSLISGKSNTSSPDSVKGESSQTSDTGGPVSAQSAGISKVDLSKISGKIKNIYYAGGSRVLVLADKLYLYDLNTGTVTAQTAKESMENDTRYGAFADGYAAAGTISSNSSSNESSGFTVAESASDFHCIFYDNSLKKTSELDFGKLLGKDDRLVSADSIAFSSDGSRIAYATFRGLYVYDIRNDKKTTVVDLTPDGSEHSGISVFEQIGFTNGGKSIAFKAQSLDVPASDKPSFDTFGMINVDGSGLSNKTADGYAAKELTAYDEKVLVAQDFKTASGKMMVMNSADGKTSIYDLKSKSEGGNIYGSDGGQYFASSTGTESGWTIRIYDTGTGKTVAEKSVSNDGEPLYGQKDPIMRMLDDAKTCIVLLGASQDSVNTKITTFAF